MGTDPIFIFKISLLFGSGIHKLLGILVKLDSWINLLQIFNEFAESFFRKDSNAKFNPLRFARFIPVENIQRAKLAFGYFKSWLIVNVCDGVNIYCAAQEEQPYILQCITRYQSIRKYGHQQYSKTNKSEPCNQTNNDFASTKRWISLEKENSCIQNCESKKEYRKPFPICSILFHTLHELTILLLIFSKVVIVLVN